MLPADAQLLRDAQMQPERFLAVTAVLNSIGAICCDG